MSNDTAIAGDGEQLRVAHARGRRGRRRVQHDLVRRLEGDVLLLAEGQGGERAVLGVLHGALQGQGAGRVGQVVLLMAVQVEPQHGAVGHDGGGHDAGGLRGGEEGVPVLHDAVQCVDPWWTERGMTSGLSGTVAFGGVGL